MSATEGLTSDEMAFEVFDAYGAASRPEATLRASGYLFISKGIMRRAGKADATHCQLQYDADTGRLGVVLTDKDAAMFDEGIRPINVEKSGASINLVPLLRYYGLPTSFKGKLILPVTFDNNLIVMELYDAVTAHSSPKQVPTKVATREEFDDDIPF